MRGLEPSGGLIVPPRHVAGAGLAVADVQRRVRVGSHEGTDFLPLKLEVEASETFALCQCKQTGDQPRCDGSHSRLAEPQT